MSVTRTFYRSSFLYGKEGGAVVSGLGVVFGIVEFLHIRAMGTPLGIILEAVLPFIGAVGLVIAGYLLWTEQYIYEDIDVPRVVEWTLIGMGVMGVIFLWILSHQIIRGGHFHHAHFILVNNLIAGSLLGFVIGTYDARSRTYQRSIHREQLKHDFLNRELRHHVLNGMQIILAEAEQLEHRSDAPPADSIATIRQRGEEIVNRVEDVRTIARAFTDEESVSLDRQDLSAVLTETVEQVDTRYEEAVVSADIPDGISVCADRFLSSVFENLLSNAIEHNDAEPSRVQISLTADEETAVVQIADNGPGIPDEYQESLFTWEEPTGGKIGMGVGLAIVNVLVDRYGGHVWVEKNDPTGTIMSVEFTRAT